MKIIWLMGLFAVLLTACGGQTLEEFLTGGDGQLDLDITDAPIDDISRVLLEVTGVRIRDDNGDEEVYPLSGDAQTCQELLDSTSPRDSDNPTRCFDLLTLQGTEVSNLINNLELNQGDYDWLQLEINATEGELDSIIETDDGGQFSLFLQDSDSGGLRTSIGFEIERDETTQLVIDIDLRRSILAPESGSNDYRFTPNVRLIAQSESGNITGTVDNELISDNSCNNGSNDDIGNVVYVFESSQVARDIQGDSNDPLTSATVELDNSSGSYEFGIGYLPAGDYLVAFTCQGSDDDPENVDNIEFSSTETVTVEESTTETVNLN